MSGIQGVISGNGSGPSREGVPSKAALLCARSLGLGLGYVQELALAVLIFHSGWFNLSGALILHIPRLNLSLSSQILSLLRLPKGRFKALDLFSP